MWHDGDASCKLAVPVCNPILRKSLWGEGGGGLKSALRCFFGLDQGWRSQGSVLLTNLLLHQGLG
jgi:hypothetical protein